MQVVIGSNFGDEGKGLVTNYLAKNWVVRFSGGAQAGHTVVHNGQRHVFHHFGSGTLKGCQTYLDRHFIVNPFVFFQEHQELLQKIRFHYQPVSVHPDCLVTFPMDMILNQAKEDVRGNSRHGSCGLGIHETMVRSESIPVRVRDLKNFCVYSYNNPIWNQIIDYTRKKILSFCIDTEPLDSYISEVRTLNIFISMVEYFLEHAIIEESPNSKDVVYEGSQGLLLDEKSIFFPHVTHARTGVSNIADRLTKEDEVIYVTRPYLTRHGAGPFPTECVNVKFEDQTNQPNPYQGTLRFGHFDLDLWKETLIKDIAQHPAKVSVAITCLSQMDTIPVYSQGCLREYSQIKFIDLIHDHISRFVKLHKIYLFDQEDSEPFIFRG